MLKTLRSVLAVLLLAVATTVAMSTLTATPSNAASSYEAQMETAIIKATNTRRSAANRGAVSAGTCVDRYAEKWSTHLAANNLFEHRTDLRAILKSCNEMYVSENLAKYPVTSSMSATQMARATVTLWMNSPGHRVNLLSPRAKTIGVGVSMSPDGKWWLITQNFTS